MIKYKYLFTSFLLFLAFDVIAQVSPQLRDTIVCRGSSINIGQNGIPVPNSVIIEWKKNGIVMPGEVGTILLNQVITQTTTYTVYVSGNYPSPGGPIPINYRDTMIARIITPSAVVFFNNPSCFGSNSGSSINIQANHRGNSGVPYTYQWTYPNGTVQTDANLTTVSSRTNIPVGNYFIKVTDISGCDTTYPVTLVAPSQIQIDTVYTPNSSCISTLCNGGLSFTPSGGTPPYNYTWDNVSTNSTTISSICPGNHTLVVRDSRTCSRSITASYTISNLIITANNTPTQPSCLGVSNGSIAVNPTNGKGPYTYTWSANANTGNLNTASNLAAGTYNVTVKDANQCSSASQSVTLTNVISALTATVAKTDNSCEGVSNGRIAVTPTNGTAPYTYTWSANANTGNLNTASNLINGSYDVSFVDNIGCRSNLTTTVLTPVIDSIRANFALTQPSCLGICNGSIVATPTNGTAPYTYTWSTNANTGNFATASNLCNDIYTLSIVDKDGCVSSIYTRTLTNVIDLVTLTNDIENSGCSYGRCVGKITLTPTNGTAPYTYTWSANASAGTTVNAPNNLCPDDYTVEVIDRNGCSSGINQFRVGTDYDSVRYTKTIINAPCEGGNCSGSILATPTVGRSPYTYTWSANANTPVNDPNARNLCAGDYTLVITDANNCVSTLQTIPVINRYSLNGVLVASDIKCNGACDGTASVTMVNGEAPYIYTWSNGTSTSSLNSLCPNVYTISVKDFNNCSWESDTTLVEPPALTGSIATEDANCPTSCNGVLDVAVTGGTGQLSYSSLPSGVLSPINHKICSDVYDVTVTDENGCKLDFKDVEIGYLELITADFTYEPKESPIDINEALIHFYDNSSRGDFWEWKFGKNTYSDVPNPEIVFTEEGTIPVTLIVSDVIGCRDSVTKHIIIADLFNLWFPNTFTPNGDSKNDNFTPKGYAYVAESFEMTIFDRWGSEIFKTKDINTGWDGMIDGKRAFSGSYNYVAKIQSLKGEEFNYKGRVSLID